MRVDLRADVKISFVDDRQNPLVVNIVFGVDETGLVYIYNNRGKSG